MATKNILVIVEGAKTDYRLIKRLFNIYQLDISFNIIPYKTNIYTLYDKMFKGNEVESLDLLQTLKEHDKDNREIFNLKYTDIILIFDLEPQDPLFNPDKITEMMNYFNESSENGKLYINYPMVEAFSHRIGDDDVDYLDRVVSLVDINKYKKIVNGFTQDPTKLGKTKSGMNKIILQNIEKASIITKSAKFSYYQSLEQILIVQLEKLEKEKQLFVLCTCLFFIVDYDSKLIK